MVPHSSTLAWKIPWTEEPGRLQVTKSRTRLSDFTFTFPFHALEKEMATHSSTVAWTIPWTEEPGGLQSMGSLRVRHNWATSLSLFTFMHWRRKWQPTPVFLPRESQGQGSLVGHDWSDLAAAAADLATWNKNYFEWKAAKECQAKEELSAFPHLPKAGHKFLFVKVTWASHVAQLVKNSLAV